MSLHSPSNPQTGLVTILAHTWAEEEKGRLQGSLGLGGGDAIPFPQLRDSYRSVGGRVLAEDPDAGPFPLANKAEGDGAGEKGQGRAVGSQGRTNVCFIRFQNAQSQIIK